MANRIDLIPFDLDVKKDYWIYVMTYYSYGSEYSESIKRYCRTSSQPIDPSNPFDERYGEAFYIKFTGSSWICHSTDFHICDSGNKIF